MSSFALSGSDSITILDRVLADSGDGDFATLEFEGEVATVKRGKNGNVIFGKNEGGNVATLTLRILRGSADDKFFNGLFSQQQAGFASFILLNGELVKQMGDGQGKITSDTYVVSSGVFLKPVNAKSNADGDTEQSLAIWTLKFGKAGRVLT